MAGGAREPKPLDDTPKAGAQIKYPSAIHKGKRPHLNRVADFRTNSADATDEGDAMTLRSQGIR